MRKGAPKTEHVSGYGKRKKRKRNNRREKEVGNGKRKKKLGMGKRKRGI
jgi:hypothetical protein